MDDEKINENLRKNRLATRKSTEGFQKYNLTRALCQTLQKENQHDLDLALQEKSETVGIALLKIVIKLLGRDKIK